MRSLQRFRQVECSTKHKNWQSVLCKGVLVQAKNGDELFREEDKFHAGNGKTQACSQGALPLLSLGLVGLGRGRGWRGWFFFHFSLVPNVFKLCSFKFPICSPTCSPQHLNFIPYALANVVLLSPIQMGQREGYYLYTSRYYILVLGSFHRSLFFF